MGVVGLYCVGTLLSIFLQCQPIEVNWDSGIPGVCGDQDAAWLGSGICNVLTDIMVLALPIRSVSKLKLPRVTKGALIGVFTIGFV